VNVTVRCLASLAGQAPPDGRLTLPDGATADDAAKALALSEAGLAVILRNGAPADRDTRLAPDDTLSFVPPISGG
jgi:sulfur-carrier protein